MAEIVVTKEKSAAAKAARLHEHLANGATVILHVDGDREAIAALEGRVHGLAKHPCLDRPGYVELSTKQ